MRSRVLTILIVLGFLLLVQAAMADEKTFVGSEACQDCHQEQYEKFTTYSKKSHSFDNIKKMEKKLTPEEYQTCFECHTTGYGQEGGFISEAQTPELKNPGCEVCHGPGSLHVESEDPEDIIGSMAMEDCITCHSQDRISEFDFKPLLYGGAH